MHLRPRQVGYRLPYDPRNPRATQQDLVAGEGIEPP